MHGLNHTNQWTADREVPSVDTGPAEQSASGTRETGTPAVTAAPVSDQGPAGAPGGQHSEPLQGSSEQVAGATTPSTQADQLRQDTPPSDDPHSGPYSHINEVNST